MAWLDDLVTLMEDGSVGYLGTDLFTSSAANVPMLASGLATLTIIETSAGGPERTQNSVVRPAYLNVSALFMARANTYRAAKAKCQAAYGEVVGIRNSWIVADREYFAGEGLASGWYREIDPLQEPNDPGREDDRGQARCVFNVRGVRRP